MGILSFSKFDASAFGAVTITPSDSATVVVCKALYVGSTGSVKVRMLDGTTPTFAGMLTGVIYPIQFDLVFATGTTATSLIGLY